MHVNTIENNLLNADQLGSFYNYLNSKKIMHSGVAQLKDELENFVANDSSKV